MTNVEIMIESAKEKSLDTFAKEFIDKLSNMSKKELRNLTKKQYEFLNKLSK